MFDIKSSEFLGGSNVHSLIIIGLVSFLVFKQVKSES